MTLHSPPLLEIRGLRKEFGSHAALKSVNFTVGKGEFIVVLGRSGAGKSTLMRCINRLADPTSGEIIFENKTLGNDAEELRLHRRRIGMIFQHFNLVKRLSVLKNVMIGSLGYKPLLPSLFHIFSRREKLEALQCLDRVDILHKAYQRADTLSGGEQQRVAIARALNQKPLLLLADEPVASLDPTIARTVLSYLKKINEEIYIRQSVLGHEFLNGAFKALYEAADISFSVFIIDRKLIGNYFIKSFIVFCSKSDSIKNKKFSFCSKKCTCCNAR